MISIFGLRRERSDRSNSGAPSWLKKLVIMLTLVIVLALALFPGFHSVPAGHRGVILEFGKPIGIALEGLYVWTPYWRQSVIDIPVQTLKFEDPHAESASKDLQRVAAKIAVNYHLDASKADEIYKTLSISWEDRVIRPALQEVVKATTAKYTAEELITKRPLVQTEIKDDMIERMKVYGIIVETINIVDFQFSKSFADAIEAKVVAEQNALQQLNVLQTVRIQAQQRIAEAEGIAKSEAARAQGTANATITKAKAEAEALRLTREQLNSNVLQLRSIEKWDGKLPVLLVTSDGKQIPFIIDISKLIGKNATQVNVP